MLSARYLFSKLETRKTFQLPQFIERKHIQRAPLEKLTNHIADHPRHLIMNALKNENKWKKTLHNQFKPYRQG